jgi:DNA-binding transcriptional ArsR family regulator
MNISDASLNKKLRLMSEVFKALSDPTRLKILLLLTKAEKLCVNYMAGKLGISQPAVSQQLKIMKHAGLIEAQKVGLYVHYCINVEMMKEFNLGFSVLFLKEKKHACVKCPDKTS